MWTKPRLYSLKDVVIWMQAVVFPRSNTHLSIYIISVVISTKYPHCLFNLHNNYFIVLMELHIYIYMREESNSNGGYQGSSPFGKMLAYVYTINFRFIVFNLHNVILMQICWHLFKNDMRLILCYQFKVNVKTTLCVSHNVAYLTLQQRRLTEMI